MVLVVCISLSRIIPEQRLEKDHGPCFSVLPSSSHIHLSSHSPLNNFLSGYISVSNLRSRHLSSLYHIHFFQCFGNRYMRSPSKPIYQTEQKLAASYSLRKTCRRLEYPLFHCVAFSFHTTRGMLLFTVLTRP
jgi:hypothetical protein